MSISTDQSKIQLFNSGEEFSKQTDCLWSIASGVVKSYTVSEEGESITLGFWGTEDLVGQSLSTIGSCNFKCMSKVKAIAVPQAQWEIAFPNLLYTVQQTQQLTFIIRNTRIARRLWLLLEWLSVKFGRSIKQGQLIDFELTHQELAEAIGATRITVTKTLNQFERKGLILRPKTKCIILKRKGV